MPQVPRCTVVTLSILVLVSAIAPHGLTAADWPMLGRTATHNPVVSKGRPPTQWDVKTGKQIKWTGKLGSMTCGDPVVADGLVWVGTNKFLSENVGRKDDAAVLACFRESDGTLLYKYVSPRMEGRDKDWPFSSLASSPLVEGDRMWFVTNRWEVVCLDIGPLKRGEGEPRPVWKCDMVKQLGIHPNGGTMHWNRLPSVASHGGRIFVVTGNGTAPPHTRGDDLHAVPAPNAPSLVCFQKDTGKILWEDNSPGDDLLSVQWSTPLVAKIDGQVQCIVPQGDGWIRSFDAATGKLIWKFDINPKKSVWVNDYGVGTRNNVLAAPVLYKHKIYIASGQMPSQGEGTGRLVCLDPTKRGDISSELAVDENARRLPHRRVQAVDPDKGEETIPNPNSGLVWEFVAEEVQADEQVGFLQEMHRCAASVAVHDGLVIAADLAGLVHCLDSETGERYWYYDTLADITAAPLIVQDRIYVADYDGDVSVFGLSPNSDEAMRRTADGFRPVAERTLGDHVWASPVYANATLYIATESQLLAIAESAADLDADREEKQAGGHWPQWRGPSRDNVSRETGLLREWPVGGPPLRWQVDGLGTGIACLALADGRIFTLGYQDGQEFAVALDEQTGELLWAQPVGPAVEEHRIMRWLTQRTPTVDGERAYFLAASGDLFCLNTTDGKTLWRRSYVEDFGAALGPWGMVDYPLVDGDRLICNPCGKRATLVALNKNTGDSLWETHVSDTNRRGYAAIVTSHGGGVSQYVAFTGTALLGIAASDGRVLWTYDEIANPIGNSHTPIVLDDFIFASSGYGRGIVLLKLDRNKGSVKMRQVYQNKLNLHAFSDPHIRIGEYIYTNGSASLLACLKWKTGKLVWRERFRGGHSSWTWADERLYLLDPKGSVTLIEVSSNGYQKRGQFTLPDFKPARGATAPVVTGGHLYLRDDNRLFCYRVRAEEHVEEPASFELPKLSSVAVEPDRRSDVATERTPQAVFVPTPADIVDKMLAVAEPKEHETVFDLGSGDGRILLAAAEKYGCRAIGYEIDRELVELARREATKRGLGERVTIHEKDLFTADLTKADVVMLYLLPAQTAKLIPQLQKQLKAGSRIVCHLLPLPGIEPTEVVRVNSSKSGQQHDLYLYVAPFKESASE